jgi:hypothetical protein
MAGYSGAPLQKKLGIKSGFRMYVAEPPDFYFDWIDPLPGQVELSRRLSGQLDLIHLFVKDEKTFKDQILKSKKYLKRDGMIWISWPKKSSGMASDLDENKIRNYGISQGLVDIKVCAVDEVWSGLKFVIPVKDRK